MDQEVKPGAKGQVKEVFQVGGGPPSILGGYFPKRGEKCDHRWVAP